jgi:hypothetical protein
MKLFRVLGPAGFVLGLGVAVCGTVTTQTGCSWFASNKTQVTTDVGQIASCVITQLFQGVTDPAQIVTACVGSTLADVDQIITSIINFYDQPDAGAAVASSGQHCGSGTPPYKGMTQCVSDAQLAKFRQASASVKMQLAQGAH